MLTLRPHLRHALYVNLKSQCDRSTLSDKGGSNLSVIKRGRYAASVPVDYNLFKRSNEYG
jgi:hypothetical protein